MGFKYGNAPQTSPTLSVGVNNSVTSFTLSSTTALPAVTTASGDFFVGLIESEIVKVTNNNTGTGVLTVTRGQEGSSAVSHSSGVTFELIWSSAAWDRLRKDIVEYGTYSSRYTSSIGFQRTYICTDSPYTFVDNGSSIQAYWNGAPVTVPDFTGYAWTNQGSSTLDTSLGFAKFTCALNVGDSYRHYYKATGGTTFTLEIAYTTNRIMQRDFQVAGLSIIESSSGKFVNLCTDTGITNGDNIANLKFTNTTTFNSSYAVNAAKGIAKVPVWLKIVQNSTDRITYYKTDYWQDYILLYSVGKTDFITADRAGINLNDSTGNAFGMNVYHYSLV